MRYKPLRVDRFVITNRQIQNIINNKIIIVQDNVSFFRIILFNVRSDQLDYPNQLARSHHLFIFQISYSISDIFLP